MGDDGVTTKIAATPTTIRSIARATAITRTHFPCAFLAQVCNGPNCRVVRMSSAWVRSPILWCGYALKNVHNFGDALHVTTAMYPFAPDITFVQLTANGGVHLPSKS